MPRQEPIIKDIAKQFEGKVIVSEVNVNEDRETAMSLVIQSMRNRKTIMAKISFWDFVIFDIISGSTVFRK